MFVFYVFGCFSVHIVSMTDWNTSLLVSRCVPEMFSDPPEPGPGPNGESGPAQVCTILIFKVLYWLCLKERLCFRSLIMVLK
jgi:hypothetical protein